MPSSFGRLLAAYGILGALMWTTPLLSILHVESSAVVATAAFFGAGFTVPSLRRQGYGLRRIILLQEAALVVPWLFLTASLLWQPNCGYLHGVLFYLAFPAVTVIFAVALHELLDAVQVVGSAFVHAVVGLLVLILSPIYDIGFHPQFYTYNHIFGGFLGPIYDEQLAIRPGLFAFRLLTLLWALFLFFAAAFLKRAVPVVPAAVAAIAIAACYVWAPNLGLITTHEVIQEQLGAVRYTEHFEIYYDSTVVTPHELDVMAEDHEFRYAQLVRKLNTTVDGRIRSYIYPDPDTKGRLTGARLTNVAPVWLEHPQTHVLYQAFERVFPHELAHVFSREFGLPIIHASVSVGLIEGLAVAMEPPTGAPTAHELMSAALLSEGTEAQEALASSRDLAQSVASRLSPLGFWTGRGAVSYTAMGSFTAFLIAEYGIEPFKRAYPWAEFEDAYGKPVESLAEEWIEHVLHLPAVSRASQDVVSARFAVPSLFEKQCPHYVPPYRRTYGEAESALIRGDTLRALSLAEEALTMQPAHLPALELWAAISIARGEAEAVAARIDRLAADTLTTSLLIRRGDAYALLGRADAARASYARARERLPAYAHEAGSLVRLRTAAIDEPGILRGYLTESAEIDTSAGPVALALAALQAAQNHNYEQALSLLRRTLIDVPSGEDFSRQRLTWLAHFAYRSGSHTEARAYADSAASAYRSVGAFNEAAAIEDLRVRIEWHASTEMERIAEAAF